MNKKIYIANTSGLGNRLETLVLAALIEDRFGHQIYLDWPETDYLHITGTRTGKLPFWERPWSVKIRDFDEERLNTLGALRIINLRGMYGPRSLQRQYVLPTAARLRPDAQIVDAIRETFAARAGRPAVAVHIRQGDFVSSQDTYDAATTRHPTPPIWWYEHVMNVWAERYPDVYFVLGYSGDATAREQLVKRFDVVTFPRVLDYQPLLPGHQADGHPVVDMFGLACCTTLIATPTSNFSHWPCNVLGPRAHGVVPPPRMQRDTVAFGLTQLWGSTVLDWRDAAETGAGVTMIQDSNQIPPPSAPITDWLG